MWRYNNVRFTYSNPVDSVHKQETTIPSIVTYKKSKYALYQALVIQVQSSFLGIYAEVDPRTVKHDTPIKF